MDDRAIVELRPGERIKPEDLETCHAYFKALQERGIVPSDRTIDQVVCKLLQRDVLLPADSLTDRDLSKLLDEMVELLNVRPSVASSRLGPWMPPNKQTPFVLPTPVFHRVFEEEACRERFKRMQARGIFPLRLTVCDYVFQVLGRQVATLCVLSDAELKALRDRLEGKSSEMLKIVRSRAKALGIRDLPAWVQRQSSQTGFSYLAGYTLETLPHPLLERLASRLCARELTGEGRKGTAEL